MYKHEFQTTHFIGFWKRGKKEHQTILLLIFNMFFKWEQQGEAQPPNSGFLCEVCMYLCLWGVSSRTAISSFHMSNNQLPPSHLCPVQVCLIVPVVFLYLVNLFLSVELLLLLLVTFMQSYYVHWDTLMHEHGLHYWQSLTRTEVQ